MILMFDVSVEGRGFFSHPSLKVNISGIAVFHELHCLVSMAMSLFEGIYG